MSESTQWAMEKAREALDIYAAVWYRHSEINRPIVQCVALALDAARLAGALSMREWQPIETAPKNGMKIDLWADGRRWTDCQWGRFDEGSVAPFGALHWRNLNSLSAPTHWMPLPEPPAIRSTAPEGT